MLNLGYLDTFKIKLTCVFQLHFVQFTILTLLYTYSYKFHGKVNDRHTVPQS